MEYASGSNIYKIPIPKYLKKIENKLVKYRNKSKKKKPKANSHVFFII